LKNQATGWPTLKGQMHSDPDHESDREVMRIAPWRLLLQAVCGCLIALTMPPIMELAGVPSWIRSLTAWVGIAMAVVGVALAFGLSRQRRAGKGS
jgi:Na+/melibiose symporter-like transporter